LNESSSAVLDAALANARKGDRDAFAVLVRAHQRRVYSVALRMLGARDVAEDLAQEVFMQLYGKLSSIESNSHLVFWLRRVVTHRAIDHLRQHPRREMVALDDLEGPAAHDSGDPSDSGDPMLQRHLRQLVLELSPDARAVMTLRYQEDLDPTDIASTLGMPINTVKSHLRRSLDTLRLKLSDEGRAHAGGTPCTKI
jgi:RNA polymerase sigma-70 factor (ECF subfamily)